MDVRRRRDGGVTHAEGAGDPLGEALGRDVGRHRLRAVVAGERAQGRGVRHQHGPAERHGLEDRHALGLVVAQQHHERRPPERADQPGPIRRRERQEVHVVLDAQFHGERPELGFVGAGADDLEVGVRHELAQGRQRGDRPVVPLVLLEAPHRAHDVVLRCGDDVRSGEVAVEVGAVGDGREPFERQTERAGEERRFEVRHSDQMVGAGDERSEAPPLQWSEEASHARVVATAVERQHRRELGGMARRERDRCRERVIALHVQQVAVEPAHDVGHRRSDEEVGRGQARNPRHPHAFDRLVGRPVVSVGADDMDLVAARGHALRDLCDVDLGAAHVREVPRRRIEDPQCGGVRRYGPETTSRDPWREQRRRGARGQGVIWQVVNTC